MDKPDISFEAFPKIPRLNRDIIITEKIDGTNAGIFIGFDDETDSLPLIHASSRKRWIIPENDNFGFARWVEENKETLIADLGVGMHFGEWWGQKIQRTYDLTEKRFSLFNTARWPVLEETGVEGLSREVPFRTPALGVVPTLYEGPWFIPDVPGDDMQILHPGAGQYAPDYHINLLRQNGSVAAPGFMDPEGIVVYHTASNQLFKATLKGDEKPKGL